MLTVSRVMKARRTKGTCPLCSRSLRGGEWICKVGRAWLHRDCVLAERRRQKGTAT